MENGGVEQGNIDAWGWGRGTFSQKPWTKFWEERTLIGEITVFFRVPRNKTKNLASFDFYSIYTHRQYMLYMHVLNI